MGAAKTVKKTATKTIPRKAPTSGRLSRLSIGKLAILDLRVIS
jgi:hypothetical protein